MRAALLAALLLIPTAALADPDCGPAKSVMPALHANGYEVAGHGKLGAHKMGEVWVNPHRDWVILRADPDKDEVCVIWRGTEWLGRQILPAHGTGI